MSNPIVILIHGIRTAASWQSRVEHVFDSETTAMIIPLKYGYFDIFRFLCPFCRRAPIERLRQELQGIIYKYPNRPIIVFAHSFGTYALTTVIKENPHMVFDKIILCGSVVSNDYDWRRIETQINGNEKRNSIINECGTKDIWPVLAQTVTWGYGASGTYGFGSAQVRDRFHDFKHSDYFSSDFVKTYWVPLIKNEKIIFSEQDKIGVGSPNWFNFFRIIPIKWIWVTFVFLLSYTMVLPIVENIYKRPLPPIRQNFEIRANAEIDAMRALTFLNGDGVPRDYTKALYLFESSANQGNATGQFYLGYMHEKALGDLSNIDETSRFLKAARYYFQAAAQGHEEAKNSLNRINNITMEMAEKKNKEKIDEDGRLKILRDAKLLREYHAMATADEFMKNKTTLNARHFITNYDNLMPNDIKYTYMIQAYKDAYEFILENSTTYNNPKNSPTPTTKQGDSPECRFVFGRMFCR